MAYSKMSGGRSTTSGLEDNTSQTTCFNGYIRMPTRSPRCHNCSSQSLESQLIRPPFINPPQWTPLTQSILCAQKDIGWDLFLDGCLSHIWEETLNLYLKSLDFKTTSLWWTSTLIRKLWDTSWDMWEHHNTSLHGKTPDTKLLGLDIIDEHIRNEHLKGIDPLMTLDKKTLF